MPPRFHPASRNATRCLIVWLLACLMPLHGMAAGVIAVIGPAHSHVAVDDGHPVLEDFRRSAPAPVLHGATHAAFHVATMFGHFHGADTPLRHHHAPADASVVRGSGDGLDRHAADVDGLNVSPTLAAFVAMLPSCVFVCPMLTPSGLLASHGSWPSLTHDPEPLERPPRAHR